MRDVSYCLWWESEGRVNVCVGRVREVGYCLCGESERSGLLSVGGE